MFNGTSDTLYIRSNDPDATILVNEKTLGTGEVVYKAKKKEDHVIKVSKSGCQTVARPVETQFDAVSLLGILIDFGIISILAVDWGATGAIHKAS